MYCPKCGEQNGEGTRFCRACGENLKVVEQAMLGRLPVTLASKLDAYIERRNERLRRDGLGSAVFGVCFLLLAAGELRKGTGLFSTGGVLLLFALFMFLVSAWDIMAYRRSLRPGARPPDSLSIKPDEQLDAPTRRTQLASPSSVTETTTRKLTHAPDRD